MRVRRICLTLTAACSALAAPGAYSDAQGDGWLQSAEAVAALELDELRGRQDVQIDIDDIQMVVQQNKGEQAATLQDNRLDGSITGYNAIATDALNGMTGIATVIQNTGNQVIIQDTTLVNITIHP